MNVRWRLSRTKFVKHTYTDRSGTATVMVAQIEPYDPETDEAVKDPRPVK